MPESFTRARIRCFRDDVKSGLKIWWRMVLQAVFGTVTTFLAVSFVRPDTVVEKVELYVLVAVGILLLTILAHICWSWMSTPRTLYYQQLAGHARTLREKDDELDRLRSSAGSEESKRFRDDLLRKLCIEGHDLENERITPEMLEQWAEDQSGWSSRGRTFAVDNFGSVCGLEFDRCQENGEFRNPTHVLPNSTSQGWSHGRLVRQVHFRLKFLKTLLDRQ